MGVISWTVDLEEWYHDLWPGAESIIERYYNYKVPKGTFREPLKHIFEVFEKHKVCSTFFVLGEIAEFFPEIVEEIYDMGHEVASHGYLHKDLTKMPIIEFEELEKKTRNLLMRTTGGTPKGFRAPLFKINQEILKSLERVGYSYDSSVVPSIRIPGWIGYYTAPLRVYRTRMCKRFFEVPVAVLPYLRFPAGGGWFLRNFGVNYVKTAIRFLLRKKLPVVLYIHPLDVYADVPKLRGIPFHITRNCGEYSLKAIEHILKTFNHCEKLSVQSMLAELYGISF